MSKNQATKSSGANGRFAFEPLGRSKAAKFAIVERLTLSGESSKTIKGLEARGLRGDSLRLAITVSFRKK